MRRVVLVIALGGCNAVFGLDPVVDRDSATADSATADSVIDGVPIDAPCVEFVASGAGVMTANRADDASPELASVAGAVVEFRLEAARAMEETFAADGLAHRAARSLPDANAYRLTLTAVGGASGSAVHMTTWSTALSAPAAVFSTDERLIELRRYPLSDVTTIYLGDDISLTHRLLLVQCVSELNPPNAATAPEWPTTVPVCSFLLIDNQARQPPEPSGTPYQVVASNVTIAVDYRRCTNL